MTAHPQDRPPTAIHTCASSSSLSSTSSSSCSTPPTKPAADTSDPNCTASFPLLSHPDALSAVLSALLQSDVAHGDTLPPTTPEHMTVFHALEAPSIPVRDYVTRLSKYLFCSPSCFVAAVHYVSRVVDMHPNLVLTSLTAHRLIITALVLACKYFDDMNYNLSYYAKVGGLPTSELANLEVHMLRMLDYRLDMSVSQFRALEACLVQRVCIMSSAITDKTQTDDKLSPVPAKLLDPVQVAPLAHAAFDMLEHQNIPSVIMLHVSPVRDSNRHEPQRGNKKTHTYEHEDEDVLNRTTMQMAALTFSNRSSHRNNNKHTTNANCTKTSGMPPSSPFCGSDNLSRNESSDALSSSSSSSSSSVSPDCSSLDKAAAASCARISTSSVSGSETEERPLHRRRVKTTTSSAHSTIGLHRVRAWSDNNKTINHNTNTNTNNNNNHLKAFASSGYRRRADNITGQGEGGGIPPPRPTAPHMTQAHVLQQAGGHVNGSGNGHRHARYSTGMFHSR